MIYTIQELFNIDSSSRKWCITDTLSEKHIYYSYDIIKNLLRECFILTEYPLFRHYVSGTSQLGLLWVDKQTDETFERILKPEYYILYKMFNNSLPKVLNSILHTRRSE